MTYFSFFSRSKCAWLAHVPIQCLRWWWPLWPSHHSMNFTVLKKWSFPKKIQVLDEVKKKPLKAAASTELNLAVWLQERAMAREAKQYTTLTDQIRAAPFAALGIGFMVGVLMAPNGILAQVTKLRALLVIIYKPLQVQDNSSFSHLRSAICLCYSNYYYCLQCYFAPCMLSLIPNIFQRSLHMWASLMMIPQHPGFKKTPSHYLKFWTVSCVSSVQYVVSRF